MSMKRPRVLPEEVFESASFPEDAQLTQLYKKNGIEKTLQARPDMNIKTSEDLENVTRELSRLSKKGGNSSLDEQNLNKNAIW